MQHAISAYAFVCAVSIPCERITRLILLMATLTALLINGAAQTSRADSAKSYVDRGNSWFKKGEIERAIADYDLAIIYDSRSAEAYYYPGLARDRNGDSTRGLTDYGRALAVNPR